jgi:hypothetical protein
MEKNKRVPRVAGNESEERGDPGAVVLKPEPPRRGTFALHAVGPWCSDFWTPPPKAAWAPLSWM